MTDMRTRISRLAAMLFLWIALVLSSSTRPACGQTISFLRELSPTPYQQASGVAVDATGVYTVAWEGADSSPSAWCANTTHAAMSYGPAVSKATQLATWPWMRPAAFM